MYRFSTKIAIALAFALRCSQAWAYIGTPFLSPASPADRQPVAVSVKAGICDAIATEAGFPQVIHRGQNIRVILLAFRFVDPIQCNLIVTTSTQVFGAYSPGDYQVTIAVFYYDDFGNPNIDDIGLLPMHVALQAATPASAPAASPFSLGILALMLGFIALRSPLRARQDRNNAVIADRRKNLKRRCPDGSPRHCGLVGI